MDNKKKYNPFDYCLLRSENHARTMNLFYVQEAHGDYRTKLVDWDLSEDEENKLVCDFLDRKLDFLGADGWESYVEFQEKVIKNVIFVPVIIA